MLGLREQLPAGTHLCALVHCGAVRGNEWEKSVASQVGFTSSVPAVGRLV